MAEVVTINNIVIDGATRVSEEGGWNAPEERVETGFDFSSYVNAEPRSITLDAWVTPEQYEQLVAIREQGEPFSASIGDIGLDEAKIPSGGLQVEQEGSRQSHYELTFTIEEIVFAETETAEIQFDAPGGELSSSAEGTDTSRSSSTPEDDGIFGGVANSLESAANSLQSSLFG